MEIKLELRSINYSSKDELRLYYKEHLLKKTYIPDLFVCDGIVVELKAVEALNAEHKRQLLNYMYITRKAIGYLINFGPIEKLEWKRFILKEFIPQQ